MINRKITAAVCAAVLALCSFASCSDSDSSSETTNNSKAQNGEDGKNPDSKLDIYIDEDGTPYYYDTDGNKMIIYSYPADDLEEEEEEYDPSQYITYDKYDAGGLSFDIPEGWYADSTYGAPMIFEDAEEGEENYDEYISVTPTYMVLDNAETEVTEDVVKENFDSLIEAGYFKKYEITSTDNVKVAGYDADSYDISFTYSLDEDEVVYRSRYIFTSGDNSYCLTISSLDTDESFKKMTDLLDELIKTLKLPTAEQMNAAQQDNEDIYLDDEDELDIDEENE